MGLREESEKLLSGERSIRERHPLMPTGESEEVAAGVMFWRWFANITAISTEEGLVLIDTGAHHNQTETVAMVRRWSPDRVNSAIYTHGHVDHAAGMAAFLAEAQGARRSRPRVVGHRAIAGRFDRYKRTVGYNSVINSRQFAGPVHWPEEYVYPDTYFDHQLNVAAGTWRFECHHARGETDDHCWVFIPSRKVLVTGDFIIWAAPNAGNPQKVQRYAREWAEALRLMAKAGAEVLLPGHGVPIFGEIHVRHVLNDTAEYLESLNAQTLAMMNEGATLDDIVNTVKPPAALAEKPYLQPVYDEPEFIVRNVWRLNGGWYDGIASHLKPPPHRALAVEVAALAGGADVLVGRALAKLEAGELAIAAELIDWAVAAASDPRAAHEARMRIYTARADEATSTMAHGIFRAVAVESADKAGVPPPPMSRVL